VYWAFTTISTTGYGDIIPRNDGERAFVTICMVFGALVFGYVVGSMASLVGKLDVGATKYREKITEVKQYMIDKQLPKTFQKKVLRYHELFLSHKSVFDEEAILSELSGSLKLEVCAHFHVIHCLTIHVCAQVLMFRNQDVINNIAIFDGQDPTFVVSRKSFQSICAGLILYFF
jgi:hypothetical protein